MPPKRNELHHIVSAKNAVLKGEHPCSAQEYYDRTGRQLEAVVKSVDKEDPNFEIDWSSV